MLLFWKTFLRILAALPNATPRPSEQSSTMSAQTFAQLEVLSCRSEFHTDLPPQIVFQSVRKELFDGTPQSVPEKNPKTPSPTAHTS